MATALILSIEKAKAYWIPSGPWLEGGEVTTAN